MTERATIRSRQVAAELRRLRKTAGFTTHQVGARLGMSQAKVSRIETGTTGMQPRDVIAMLGLYQVPAKRRDEILELVEQAGEPGWIQIHGKNLPEQWQTFMDWEDRALYLLFYQVMVIPGIVQTSDYARTMIAKTSVVPLTETELDTRVAARLGRQNILSRKLHLTGTWCSRRTHFKHPSVSPA